MDEVTRLRVPASSQGTPDTPRRKAIEHPGRFAIVAVGLMAVASLVAIALVSADTSEIKRELPKEVQSVSPAQGAIVPPQQPLEIDLQDNLTGRFVIRQSNGGPIDIPDDQVTRRPGQSILTFTPGDGKDVESYEPGLVNVTVYFQRIGDTTYQDIGSYSWSFTSKS